MRSRRLWLLAKLSVATSPLILTGCAPTTVSSGTEASFCGAARAIYWSTKDTDQTIAQVREHNAVGKSICGWGK